MLVCGFAGIEGVARSEGPASTEGVAGIEDVAGIVSIEGVAGSASAGISFRTCVWAFFFAAVPCFPARTCFVAFFCGFAFVAATASGPAVSPSIAAACTGPSSGVALQEAEESVGIPVVMRNVQPWPQAWLRASWMEVENRAWAKCATKALGA